MSGEDEDKYPLTGETIMTHLTTNATSLTNTPSATSVSPLGSQDSNKDKLPESLSLIPFEPISRAVALTYFEVIFKQTNNRRLASNPYATAFCRHYFGNSKPSRSELDIICRSPYPNIPQIMKNLDSFLGSFGQNRYQINYQFVIKAFPSLEQSKDVRFDNNLAMKHERNIRIYKKKDEQHKRYFLKKCSELDTLNNTQIATWVQDNQIELSEPELIRALSEWYKKHDNSGYSFHDLYQGYEAIQIAYDLGRPE